MFDIGPIESPDDARRLLGLLVPGGRRREPPAGDARPELWALELDGGGYVRSLRGGAGALARPPARTLVVVAPGQELGPHEPLIEALVADAPGRLCDILWCTPSHCYSARAALPTLPWHPAVAWCMRDSLDSLDPWANIARFQPTTQR